jgi:hypothetical protein
MRGKYRFLARVGLVLGVIVLAYYWWRTIVLWNAGTLFSHNNYWGAPVGTITAFIVLIAVTPLLGWALFKYWNWNGPEHEND